MGNNDLRTIAFLLIMLGQGEGDIRSATVIPRDMIIYHKKGCSHAAAVNTLVAQRNVEGCSGKWAEGK